MRVITGSARGRKLISPSGDDVRPTTDVVKEAVFSIIQFSVEGCSFLDAFAGSGQMGIEAVSRGASKVYMIDSSRRSMSVIKKNIALCGFENKAVTVVNDTLTFLANTKERFDTVFLDPPYKTGLLQAALEKAVYVVNKGGCIICEHPREEELPLEVGSFAVKKSYRYGQIVISVYVEKNDC